MAHAIRIHKPGGPEVMQLDEVILPPPGPGEVRLKQHAIGLNFIDVYFRSGAYPAPQGYPLVLGAEGAGEITALGPDVTQFKVGDRVAYGTAPGAYADERNIAAAVLVTLADAISYETGAAMMLKGLTAQYLLRRTYHVKPGDTILVHAAAGGMGLLLCQWGKALGATVIGTVGSAEKAARATEAGADHVILYREEDFVARVAAITKGAKCQVVYDGVGKTTYPGSLDCLAPLGMFASFGSASGKIENFDINLLAPKGSLFVTRPTLFTYAAKRADLEAMAADLMAVVASGAVKIPINARYKLADAANAHRALEGRETTGATVLTV